MSTIAAPLKSHHSHRKLHSRRRTSVGPSVTRQDGSLPPGSKQNVLATFREFEDIRCKSACLLISHWISGGTCSLSLVDVPFLDCPKVFRTNEKLTVIKTRRRQKVLRTLASPDSFTYQLFQKSRNATTGTTSTMKKQSQSVLRPVFKHTVLSALFFTFYSLLLLGQTSSAHSGQQQQRAPRPNPYNAWVAGSNNCTCVRELTQLKKELQEESAQRHELKGALETYVSELYELRALVKSLKNSTPTAEKYSKCDLYGLKKSFHAKRFDCFLLSQQNPPPPFKKNKQTWFS